MTAHRRRSPIRSARSLLAVLTALALTAASAAQADPDPGAEPGFDPGDVRVDLPDDAITQTLPDGTAVTLSVHDSYAWVKHFQPTSMATTRGVWAFGSVRVDIEGRNDEGRITPGYIVGCQFTFGAQGGTSFNGGTGSTGTGLTAGVVGGALQAGSVPGALGALAPAASAYLPSGSIGFTISPGQAVDMPMLRIEEPDDYGNQTFDNYFAFAGNHGGTRFTSVVFGVDGCAGYAQARAYTRVRIKNAKTMAWVTIWGPPFSLG